MHQESQKDSLIKQSFLLGGHSMSTCAGRRRARSLLTKALAAKKTCSAGTARGRDGEVKPSQTHQSSGVLIFIPFSTTPEVLDLVEGHWSCEYLFSSVFWSGAFKRHSSPKKPSLSSQRLPNFVACRVRAKTVAHLLPRWMMVMMVVLCQPEHFHWTTKDSSNFSPVRWQEKGKICIYFFNIKAYCWSQIVAFRHFSPTGEIKHRRLLVGPMLA